MPLGGSGSLSIAPYEAPQPLDQTDLNVHLRLILKVDGGRIRNVSCDWPQGLGGPQARWGGHPCVPTKLAPLCRVTSSSLLDCSRVDLRIFSLCKSDMWTSFCSYSDNPLQK